MVPGPQVDVSGLPPSGDGFQGLGCKRARSSLEPIPLPPSNSEFPSLPSPGPPATPAPGGTSGLSEPRPQSPVPSPFPAAPTRLRPEGGAALAAGREVSGAPGAGGASLVAEPRHCAEAGPAASTQPEARLDLRESEPAPERERQPAAGNWRPSPSAPGQAAAPLPAVEASSLGLGFPTWGPAFLPRRRAL